MDKFKKKSENNEEWFYPVSSNSYFIPFKIGKRSITEPIFNFNLSPMIDFTEKILSLKAYLTKETSINL